MANLSGASGVKRFDADTELKDAIDFNANALKERLGDGTIPTLVKSLEDRLNFHRGLLLRQRNIARPLSNFLTYAIPCAAAFITFLTALKDNSGSDPMLHFFSRVALSLPVLGFVLSILTLVNSIYKPVERKLMVSQTLINLHDLELRLYLLLHEHNRIGDGAADGSDRNFYDDIVQWDKDLSKLGGTMVQMVVPHGLRDAAGERAGVGGDGLKDRVD
ncbi:MAG: hypothetical protein JST42_31095 [Bacteroidetes bacterium]|nr:hypothetical protein [Bacteroidota bacterium]